MPNRQPSAHFHPEGQVDARRLRPREVLHRSPHNSIIFLLLSPIMKDNKGSLSHVRVLKKSMIFLQSYDEVIPTQVLKTPSTFATCGRVQTVKTKQNYKNTTSYVTFAQKQQAAVALIAFYHLSGRLRVLFGTVQYCKYFMRKAECRNETCVFLHVRDKKNQIIVNDQIDDDVYDDHYDMALKIAEEEHFKTIRGILANPSIEDTNIIKKGLRIALQDLNLDIDPGAVDSKQGGEQASDPKEPELFQHSTEQSELTESKDQAVQKKEQQLNKQQKVLRSFSPEDYIKIRIIKKIIRQHSSKIYGDEGGNQQHIHNRSKMMLYRIVRY